MASPYIIARGNAAGSDTKRGARLLDLRTKGIVKTGFAGEATSTTKKKNKSIGALILILIGFTVATNLK